MHSLVGIEFHEARFVQRLTFRFSRDMFSPPKETYYNDDVDEFLFDVPQEVGSITFVQSTIEQDFQMLQSMIISDFDENIMKQISGT